jgi:hypothetical protein
LYKVTINAPFTFFKSFQLTQGYSYINVNQWDTQSFLINPTTNTIVFNLVNTNSPPVPSTMYLGMYYLHVHTNGCIGYLPLPGGCPPGPNTTIFGPVYKHYPSQTYQAGQS